MAVYTEVADDRLALFLKEYAIGRALAFKGIAEGVENTNYLLITEQGTYILTLYERRVDARDLPFFLGLIEHLALRGVPCPRPVHGRDGRVLRELNARPAAITSFLRGVSPHRPRPPQCRAVGQALAKLHLAGEGFAATRKNALSVEGWRTLLEAVRPRAHELAPGLMDELDAEYAALRAEWPAALPRGIIHADLFPDNVFFEDDRLTGLIDFYFACNDFFAYDVAVCLNAWCFEPDSSFNVTKARLMLSAYCKERPLTPAERASLPLLARGAALRFFLTRAYDWLNQVDGALVRPKDPVEFLKILRFHRGVAGPGAYGLDEAA